MPTRKLLLDTNLLSVLAVGLADVSYLSVQKGFKAYGPEDFRALKALAEASTGLVITPNTLTETCNLVDRLHSKAKARVYQKLAALIQSTEETYVPSAVAAAQKAFFRLGLTDAVMLHLASRETYLVTADLDLYLAAHAAGYDALNFNYLPHRNA